MIAPMATRLSFFAALTALAMAGCGKDGGPDYAAVAFPAGFLWGTATAAHQVEGGNDNNDWHAWEQLGGKIANGDVSGAAADHYARFDEDFALAQGMANNAHRFSIEWSRIEPQRDVYDPAEIAHYHAVIDALKARGLRPVVTLQHFTLPLWMDDPANPAADLDHFLAQDGIDEFVEFAGDMAEEFGADVDWWVTLNEPMVVAVAAMQDVFPPGFGGDVDATRRFVVGMIFAHAGAYDAIHARDTVDADTDGAAAKVGIAQHMIAVAPKDPASAADQAATERIDYLFNRLFLEAVVRGKLDVNFDADILDTDTTPPEGDIPALLGRADYLGLNYYRKFDVVAGAAEPILGFPVEVEDLPKNELGWSIYPPGIHESLVTMDAYGLPILVTENGMPDGDDGERPGYLVDHLVWVARAIDEGIPVVGYLHWSLIDNFEWAEGFEPRFGLYRVDYATQERTATGSAAVFREICEANALTASVQNRYRSVPE